VAGAATLRGLIGTTRHAIRYIEGRSNAESSLLGPSDGSQKRIKPRVLNRADLQKPGVSYLPYYHRDYETHYPELEFSSVNAAGPDTLLPEVPSDPRHPQEQT